MFQHSVSGVIFFVAFSFCRLLFQLHLFWQYSIISKSVKYVTTSTYHRDLINENIITKLQKLYSSPRNPRVGNKSPMLFAKKPLCTGDLLPACKILIERHVCVTEPDFLKKKNCPKKEGNGPNIGFFEFIGKFSH